GETFKLEERRELSVLIGRMERMIVSDDGNLTRFKNEMKAISVNWAKDLEGESKETKAFLSKRNEELTYTLIHECSAHQKLQDIGLNLARTIHPADYDVQRLIRLLRERADGYFSFLWAHLTDQEKL